VTDLGESRRLVERARGLVPGWTQTLSKNPTQWIQGVAPAYVARAEGAHVWDVDGNRYVDLPMALGAVLLGHAHPAVAEAIERQLRDGIVFTLPHPIELEVAELVLASVPGAERVRFAKGGSDANSAAVRLARAITGRDVVLVCGYHGWHDWFIGSTSRGAGVPEPVRALVDEFPFNDLDGLDAALQRHDRRVAAVMLEPVGASEPAPGFLEGVVERARAAGALAIFDEIITGFRIAPGGAQERYGVTADIATFGKAIGNGMPLSAIAGRAEIMDQLGEVFFSGTHGGETLSLAAARAVLGVLDADAYDHIERIGERLRSGITQAIGAAGLAEWVTIGGAAARTVVQVREPHPDAQGLAAKTVVQQELARAGVLFNGSNFVSLAMDDEVADHVIAAYESAFKTLAPGLPDDLDALLAGAPIAPAFRQVR
jgi:glutamate-1-semialdehyde aminotransferase